MCSFVAVETHQLVLEPFAARFFGTTPAETTRLDGFFRLEEIVTLGIGAVLVGKIGHRPTATIGMSVAIVALLFVVGSALLEQTRLLLSGAVVLGLGARMLETTNLAYMMSMTDAQNAGTFTGAWEVAQGVGVGSADVLGGAPRDLGLLISGSRLTGYLTAYGFKIIMLVLAIPVPWRMGVARFRLEVGTDFARAQQVPDDQTVHT
jgi:hypothetical protein